VGGGPLEGVVIYQAQRLLAAAAPSCAIHFALDAGGDPATPAPVEVPPGEELGMKCGGEVTVFLDVIPPGSTPGERRLSAGPERPARAGGLPAGTRRCMPARLSLSIAATLALGLAVSVGAAADATNSSKSSDQAPTANSQSSKPASTNDQIDAAEEDDPDSVDYANRPADKSATNAEIDAVEQGDPDSYDNKDDPPVPAEKHAKKKWRKSESADPDAQSAKDHPKD
jgi:hypothetical protein